MRKSGKPSSFIALLIWASLAAASLAAGSRVASAEVPSALLELLERSANVRFVLRDTTEGAALAESVIGHPVRNDADFRLLADELSRPSRASLADELSSRLPRFENGSGETWLRMMARDQLAFRPGEGGRLEFLGGEAEPRGYASARAGFLAGGAVMPAVPATTMPRLNVAAVQYPIEGGRTLEQMLAKMEGFVREAKAGGAQLVVFPELFAFDLVHATGHGSSARQLAEIARTSTPRLFARAAELSRELDVTILSGSSPRAVPEGIVNTAQISFADGRTLLQDKIFLTPEEAAWGWKPGRQLKVFDAPWGRSTILICYDSQFPTLSAALGPAAPEVILVPSMTGASGFNRVRWAAQARAVEHHAFVVVTGDVDATAATSDYVGQAAILTPQDTGFPGTLSSGPLNQGAVVYGELDLARLRSSRQSAGIYAARDAQLRGSPVEVVFVP